MEVIVDEQPAGQMFVPFPAQASMCQQYEETWISSNQAHIQHKYNSSVKTFILHLKSLLFKIIYSDGHSVGHYFVAVGLKTDSFLYDSRES